MVDNGLLYVSEISRFFNAEDYDTNGYMDAISLSETVIFFKDNLAQNHNKGIAKNEIAFF